MTSSHRLRRALATLLTIAVPAAVAPAARAQETFPTRPITYLIGQPPGGAQDLLARLLAPLASERLGQPLVVENRNGAGGIVALAATARAKPDGYTIGVAGSGAIIGSLMTKDLPFDPGKDLGAVAILSKTYSALVAAPGSRYASISQLIAEAKAKPGTISFTLLGGGGRIMLARIEKETGARFNLIPYTSGAAAVTALLGGHVDIAVDTLGSAANNVKASKVRVLAVTSMSPHESLPGVPSVSSVVRDYELASWTGVFSPPGVPAERVTRMNQAFNRALEDPQVRAAILKTGQEIAAGMPAEFAGYIAREINEAAPLIKQYNLWTN